MQMILKSMGVKVDKDEMDGYAAEVDEEAAGKFTFLQFCQVNFVNQGINEANYNSEQLRAESKSEHILEQAEEIGKCFS